MQVRSTGPTTARIMIVGEAPGEHEIGSGIPFSGNAGSELNRMLEEAGISRSECFLTYVARERPTNNDIGDWIAFKKKDFTIQHRPMRDAMVKQQIINGYEILMQEIKLVQPTLIIALGNAALWALTGKWGINDWRGSELHCDKITYDDGWAPTVIPTYHPAAIFRQWTWRTVAVHDLKKAKRMAAERKRISAAMLSIIIDADFSKVYRTLADLSAKLSLLPTWVSVDIETRNGQIACVGFAWSDSEAICVPLLRVGRSEGYWSETEEAILTIQMRSILSHKNIRIIGQNFSYDAQYIDRFWGFIPIASHDTMLAQHSMFSNLPKDLAFLASLYCKQYTYWKDDSSNWAPELGEKQLWRYNCEDCCRTYEIAMEQIQTLEASQMAAVNDFQQSLFGPVHRMMQRGVKIDLVLREKLRLELESATLERMTWLTSVCGHPLNPKSPKQMHSFFVDDLQQKPFLKRRATGKFTPCFDNEGLSKIAAREPLLRPIVDAIADIRSLGVFLSTFIEATLDWDGRIRCSYNIGGTVTYRFSSNSTPFDIGTNLQNISSGDKE